MNRRPLKKIESELATTLKREAKSVIKAGGLLVEAKEQLDGHGRWLLWLKDKFPFSIRTAQNYMSAHAFATKYATVAHLRLTVGALYALADADRKGNTEAVETTLDEAKTQWVDDSRVWEIISALELRRIEEALGAEPSSDADAASDEAPPDEDEASDGAQPPDEAGDEARDEAPELEPEPADNRPPPTPPPSLNQRQAAQLGPFEVSVKVILGLVTKPAQEFLTSSIPNCDLENAADFLRQIVTERSKAAGERPPPPAPTYDLMSVLEREELKAAGDGQGGDAVQMEEAKS